MSSNDNPDYLTTPAPSRGPCALGEHSRLSTCEKFPANGIEGEANDINELDVRKKQVRAKTARCNTTERRFSRSLAVDTYSGILMQASLISGH